MLARGDQGHPPAARTTARRHAPALHHPGIRMKSWLHTADSYAVRFAKGPYFLAVSTVASRCSSHGPSVTSRQNGAPESLVVSASSRRCTCKPPERGLRHARRCGVPHQADHRGGWAAGSHSPLLAVHQAEISQEFQGQHRLLHPLGQGLEVPVTCHLRGGTCRRRLNEELATGESIALVHHANSVSEDLGCLIVSV